MNIYKVTLGGETHYIQAETSIQALKIAMEYSSMSAVELDDEDDMELITPSKAKRIRLFYEEMDAHVPLTEFINTKEPSHIATCS